jgi:hypothetical protein
MRRYPNLGITPTIVAVEKLDFGAAIWVPVGSVWLGFFVFLIFQAVAISGSAGFGLKKRTSRLRF